MLGRRRTMIHSVRAMLCAVLAVVLALTPLGTLAHSPPSSSGFVPDLCTAQPAGTQSNPAEPASHPVSHAQCGDCSTCGVQFAPRAALEVPAILVAAVALYAGAVATPPKAVANGVVARPRGPPLLG